jgi:hypothetical protein
MALWPTFCAVLAEKKVGRSVFLLYFLCFLKGETHETLHRARYTRLIA